MKKLITATLLFSLSTVLFGQNRMESAKKMASEKHAVILLNFSGSDWCIPCIKLHKNIIESAEFKELQSENEVVYVNADFPRGRKHQLAPEITKENAALAELYNKKGIFPYMVALDSDGKILANWEGLPSENAAEFSSKLKSLKAQSLEITK